MKTTWLQIRLSPSQKQTLKAKAEAAGEGLSEFVLNRVVAPSSSQFSDLIDWMLRAPDSHVPYAEFVDYLRALPASRGAELAEPPARFGELTPLHQNHVCAFIEHRALLWGVHPPAWILSVPALARPHYGGGLMNLRPYHLVVAPVVYRRRNLFIEHGLAGRLVALTPPATPAEALVLARAFRTDEGVSPRQRISEATPPYGDAPKISRADILRLLSVLDEELTVQQVRAELLMVGGAVMTVVFQAREQTKDIDAVFEPAAPVREAVRRIAVREQLAEDWLNDAVAGFLSPSGQFDPFFEGKALRVFVARPDYLLAMKILAMRLDEAYQDVNDIRFLCRYLGVTTAEQAMDIVERYYPVSRLQARNQFALEELLA